MPKSTCTAPDCNKPHKAHGYCNTHYRRVRRNGTPEVLPVEHFFWQKVDKAGDDECWLWRGTMTSTGYGRFRRRKAHRVSAEIAGMDIAGKVVRHHCDVPLCVNPAHLAPGTHADNMRDAVERDRFRSGEAQRSAKLRAVDIPKILELARSGSLSYQQIAERFGVSKYAIYCVVSGRTWKSARPDTARSAAVDEVTS